MRKGQMASLLGSLSVLVVVALTIGTVGAHQELVDADDQVSEDNVVVLSNAHASEDRYAVLYADDGGDSGRIVGYTHVSRGTYFGVRIEIDEEFWAASEGTLTLRPRLHSDDGDGQFEPSDDRIVEEALTMGGSFQVRKSTNGNVSVVPGDVGFEGDEGVMTLRRVELATDGFVVLHVDEGGEPGEPVGWTPLRAGAHEDVPVALDEAFLQNHSGGVRLWATVHSDDGDGQFDADDPPVRVGGSPAGSRFYTEKIQYGEPRGADASIAFGEFDIPETFVEFAIPAALVVVLLTVSMLIRRRLDHQ